MAVTYHAGNILRGTTAERTGGTWTNLPAGWIYIESDGLSIYRWSGTVWSLVGSSGGTLGVASGGTGATTLTGILKGNGTSAITTLTDPLPIANGGTSGATAAAGFDALSPMTTLGDLIYGGTSGTRTALAGQTTKVKQVLTQTGTNSVSAAPAWSVDPVFPSSGRKYGSFQGNSTTAADGIWAGGMTSIGTATGVLFDTTNGSNMTYTTGGTSGNPAGQRYSNTSGSMAFNTRLKVKFSNSVTTNNALYVGFLGTAADFAATDDPFASARGIAVGQRSTDTVYVIGSGENTASGTWVNYNKDGAGATMTVDTSPHTFEIVMTSATNFAVRIDANSWHTITSPLPSNAVSLFYCAHIHQSATEGAHNIKIFYSEIELDK